MYRRRNCLSYGKEEFLWVHEISMLMIYEVGCEFELEKLTIETLLNASCRVKILHEENFIVAILRAGLAIAEGVLKILPDASGFIATKKLIANRISQQNAAEIWIKNFTCDRSNAGDRR